MTGLEREGPTRQRLNEPIERRQPVARAEAGTGELTRFKDKFALPIVVDDAQATGLLQACEETYDGGQSDTFHCAAELAHCAVRASTMHSWRIVRRSR